MPARLAAESKLGWVPEFWRQRLGVGGLVLPMGGTEGFVRLLEESTVVTKNTATVDSIFGICREGFRLVSLVGNRNNTTGEVRGELEFGHDNPRLGDAGLLKKINLKCQILRHYHCPVS